MYSVKSVKSEFHTRWIYAAAALATIALGLLVHFHGAGLGNTLQDKMGDALWAAMIFWWVGLAAPGARLLVRSGVASAICGAVELSQLIHSPALDSLRATLPGRLMLGSGFDPRDLLAYAVGVVGAALVETGIRRGRGIDGETAME